MAQPQTVGVLGLGLVAANFWLSDEKKDFAKGALTGGASDTDQATAHTVIKTTGIEILFVAVAALLAAVNDSLGSAMIAVMVALFVVWALVHFSGQK